MPGFSYETLGEILSGEALTADWLQKFPSGRFALECAGHSDTGPVPPVGVNFLWIPEVEPLDRLMARLEGVAHPCVKVKLGPNPDFRGVLNLLADVKGARLRLDPNRRWDVETALKIFRALPEESLEYIEEPFGEFESYAAIWGRCPVPVALDESLLASVPGGLAEHPQVKALVIKPTLMGDAEDREPWVRLAAETGKSLVWSSCFESGVGLWHLARLASETGGTVSGLDTGRVFAEDLVEPRPLPKDGFLACAEWRVIPQRYADQNELMA
ncbi:MAG: hypothetical protein JJU05_02195 [Verrucomicrobia bacterium]|nr:hypothetical protein [Verrucomicrobiota bacterium]